MESDFLEAARVLDEYFDRYVRQVADEVISQRDSFESPFLGRAEDLLEKYFHNLHAINVVQSALMHMEKRENPPQTYPPRAEVLVPTDQDIGAAVNTWLEENPGRELISAVPVAVAEKLQILVIYQGATDSETSSDWSES